MHPDGVTAWERPLRFPAGGEELFGILTAPEESARRVGVVLLNGGAYTPSTGRNRFSVRLARRLAAAGFHALRFDYHGVGESTGRVVRYSLNRPFTTDVLGAVELLRREGLEEVLFVGRCFGARSALSAAAATPGLRGIAFVSMPLHDLTTEAGDGTLVRPALDRRTLAMLRDPRRRRWALRAGYYAVTKAAGRLRRNGQGNGLDWVSGDVVRWLEQAVGRGLPLLFMYGSKEIHYREFTQAQGGPVGALLSRAGGRAEVWTTEGAVHDLTTLWVQEAIIERVMAWADRQTSRANGTYTPIVAADTKGRME